MWLFQDMEVVNGAVNWSFIDSVLATAEARGFKVIPVLDNSDRYCMVPNKAKTDTWYQGGYNQIEQGNIMSYHDWVQAVVSRYASNPTIAMWMLMNEAQDPTSSGTCPSNATSTLETFATTIGGLIHSIDPNHLVALGTRGVQADCGADSPTDYQQVMSSPGIDVCEMHEYDSASAGFSTVFKNDLAACNSLGKPTIVGEAGIKTTSNITTSVRAADFDKKISTQFGAGVSGFLTWVWLDPNDVTITKVPYAIVTGDPTLPILGKYSPPVTAVIIPSANGSLSGTAATLDATATDGSSITKVEFDLTGGALNSTLIATATPTQYGWLAQWNSTSVPNGTYTLQSVAYSNGLVGRSVGLSVNVSN